MDSQNMLMAWNTDLPIICAPFESTYKVARAMAHQKNNCALVRDPKRNKIVGIFTAKDLAFKIVAKGLHPQLLKAKDIMTASPICATVDEPASVALNKMIRYKIRHLPLLDNTGECIGLLDITKCFHQTLTRLRKLAASSRQLNEALSEVQENIANMDHDDVNLEKHTELYYQAQDMVLKAKDNISSLYQTNLAFGGDGDSQDFEMLLQSMSAPTLTEVLQMPKHPQTLYIDGNSTIRQAADIMKKNNTTAVLVRDTTTAAKSVIGILTTKDIVYRVLAQDDEPNFTIINRVMTPGPEYGHEAMGIVDAFEVMYEGHFLNLPVTDEMQNVIGLVSVLQLTTMALSRLHSSLLGDDDDAAFLGESSPVVANNPKWDQFWGSMPTSSSLSYADDLRSDYSIRSSGPPIRSSMSSAVVHRKSASLVQSPRPSLPGSRALFMDQDDSFELTGEITPEDSISCYGTSEVNSMVSHISDARRALIKAQRSSYTFKLKDVDHDGRSYKIKVGLPKSKNLLPQLSKLIADKFGAGTIYLGYSDEDGDNLSIETEDELKSAMEVANIQGKTSIGILVSKIGPLASTLSSPVDNPMTVNSSKQPTRYETSSGIADFFSRPEIVVSGVVLTLSFGILLGTALTRKR